ncbi:MAG TPA: ABC transporter ATP-binding protein [Pseudonocardiaceae bacterium]|nr:ABC transporter ATP-binding protein [Pseudonocardiaceae bacterium]
MTVNGDTKIRVDHLAKSYGDHVVFSDVSFDVREGEIVSIVGPSGCGKTTLLRCVAGLMRPTGGAVEISGEQVVDPPEGVAMVFQHFGLFPWKTVVANVAYGLTVRGAGKREAAAKVASLIKLVGLDGFEKSYPYQLSGGMQQRAGLARALAIEPSVLVMDEPFAALDAQTRDVLQLELLRIWDTRRAAMMFVTHSIDEAVLMGDRVVILRGRPSSIFDIVDVGIPRPRGRAAVDTERFRVVRDYVWRAVMQDAALSEAQRPADVDATGVVG